MTKLNPKTLIRKHQFRALTGVTPAIFAQMLAKMKPSWDKREAKKRKIGRPHAVGGLEEHLVLLLSLYRCPITQDFMAWVCGTDIVA